MKLQENFSQFVIKNINLNKTREELLNERKETISRLIIDNNLFKDKFIELEGQGSYYNNTIIKPVDENQKYDVDILLKINYIDEWEAKDYIDNIYKIFRENGNYKNINRKGGKCLVIEYADNFNIDVTPLVKDIDNQYKVADRNKNGLEPSNPQELNDFIKNKNTLSNGKLVEVIKLIKYIKREKMTFSLPSTLMYVLLGNLTKENAFLEYIDLPTAFHTYINDLSDFLTKNEKQPEVLFPGNDFEEDLMKSLTEEQYENLRKVIKNICEIYNEGYNSIDRNKSIEKYRCIFGNKFPDKIEELNKIENFLTSNNSNRPFGGIE